MATITPTRPGQPSSETSGAPAADSLSVLSADVAALLGVDPTDPQTAERVARVRAFLAEDRMVQRATGWTKGLEYAWIQAHLYDHFRSQVPKRLKKANPFLRGSRRKIATD